MLELKFFDNLISVRVICRDSRIAQNTLLSLSLLLGFLALFSVVLLNLANDFELILQLYALRQRFLTLLGHLATLRYRALKQATSGRDAHCDPCLYQFPNETARCAVRC